MKLARLGGISLSLGLPILGLLMVFQNCAKIQTVDLATEDYLYKKSLPVPKYMSATIGKDAQFPDLKMVFVVDNSYSMVKNNVTLSGSFQKMFDSQLSSSLDPFSTSVYIINTAQNTVAPGADRFSLVPKADPSSFLGRASNPDGLIPGDVIGYRLAYSSNANGTFNADYTPAPVVGYSQQGVVSDRILKPVGGSVRDLSDEFQRRLKVLDGSLVPSSFIGIDPLDNESGMCGLARMLKSPEKYFKTGDQVAYVIASDEKENAEDAKKCIENMSKSLDPSSESFTGYCDAPQTTVYLKNYRTRVVTSTPAGYTTKLKVSKLTPATNDSCSHKYYNSIKVTLADNVTTTTKESCSYSYVSGIKYKTNKKSYTTKIDYNTLVNTCVAKGDGISECKDVSTVTSKTASGQVAECVAKTKELDPKMDTAVTPKCTIIAADNFVTSTLSAMDKVMSLPDKAKACPADIATAVSAVNFDSCDIVDYVTATGSKSYDTPSADQAAANMRCQADAEAAAVTAVKGKLGVTSVATLAKPTTTLTNRPVLTLTLAGLTSLPAKGACSDEVKALVASQPAYVSCAVEPGAAVTSTEGLGQQYGSGLAAECSNRAAAICSGSAGLIMSCSSTGIAGAAEKTADVVSSYADTSNPGTVTCDTLARSVGVQVDGTLKSVLEAGSGIIAGSCNVVGTTQNTATTATNDYDGAFTCDSMCSASGSLCSGIANADMTVIKDYLAISGKSCTASDVSTTSSDVKVAALSLDDAKAMYNTATRVVTSVMAGTKSTALPLTLVSKKDSACPAGTTLRMNLPTSTATGGVVTRFVVGNKDASTPAMSLSQYIYSRSQELFGSNSPFASVFVITAKDTPGASQSLGQNYSTLSSMFGGNTESINAPDYSPALVNLSGLIKSRLSRSVQVTGMEASHQVRQVWLKRRGQSDFGIALDSSMYSAAGNTVVFKEGIELQLGDEVKVEYW